jgi:hypothetical protein
MFLFVGSRPMWWTADRPAARHTAGTVSVCRSYRYSDMFCIQHTFDTHALTTPLVTSLQMGYSVRLSECHTVSRYTCKRNFIKKSTAFPAPLSMKLINTQQRYMESSSAEFHTNRLWNIESTSRNKNNSDCYLDDFHEIRAHLTRFCTQLLDRTSQEAYK